jgi:histo-blood group ABO system transferase
MKVSLLIIATNKYTKYLPKLLSSLETFFLKGHDVEYCIFTDKTADVFKENKRHKDKLKIFYVPHLPWPNSTLKRFHFFNENKEYFNSDYVFYIDADTRLVDYVSDEILSDLVAVQHCGYVGERGTYETRELSMAYIAPNEGQMYFGGGFLGGKAENFWQTSETIANSIDVDTHNGITATYHDESHWNRYLVDNPPTKVLSPSYHFPENHAHIYSKWQKAGVSYRPKILLLSKNHKEMRK